MTNKVWLLVETEYEGQCTGFSSYETVLGVFLSKPEPETIAPFVGKHLSSDMGVAINQVSTLVNTSSFSPSRSYDIELRAVPVGELLDT